MYQTRSCRNDGDVKKASSVSVYGVDELAPDSAFTSAIGRRFVVRTDADTRGSLITATAAAAEHSRIQHVIT